MNKKHEMYIDHEVRIRMQELCYQQLNSKLNMIMSICGAIFLAVIVPIGLHAFGLI